MRRRIAILETVLDSPDRSTAGILIPVAIAAILLVGMISLWALRVGNLARATRFIRHFAWAAPVVALGGAIATGVSRYLNFVSAATAKVTPDERRVLLAEGEAESMWFAYGTCATLLAMVLILATLSLTVRGVRAEQPSRS